MLPSGDGLRGYRPGPWSCEDGGPARRQVPASGPRGLGIGSGDRLEVTAREVMAATMVVTRDPGEVYLLRHTGGDDAVCAVERLDPVTLDPLATSGELAGGPAWPGSVAAHADGSLHVVFGNHAHRLGPDLSLLASRQLPRRLPYNGFVVLDDGTLVTKDFGGSRPGAPVAATERRPCQLVALEPEGLEVVGTCDLPEPSIARLSADGDTVYVVGDTSLLRVRWDRDAGFAPDDGFRSVYRTEDGQGYGWDCVLAAGAAWFLDDGDGSERYDGTLRGHGVATAPLHLVRVDLGTGAVATAEICGLPGGLVANPPVVDGERTVAVGYDSGNGVLAAFTDGADGSLAPRWRRDQSHAPHLVLFPATGELVTGDFDAVRGAEQVVVLDVDTGAELARADTGSPLQSVLFPAVGFDRDVYLCSFSTVTRVAVRPAG